MPHNARSVMIALVLTTAAILIAGYSLFQLRNIIRGPIVVIKSPVSGATVSQSLLEVRGVAQNVSHISLNDRPITIDQEGNFSDLLLLPQGYTILTVKAGDRFGRSVTRTIELIYQ